MFTEHLLCTRSVLGSGNAVMNKLDQEWGPTRLPHSRRGFWGWDGPPWMTRKKAMNTGLSFPTLSITGRRLTPGRVCSAEDNPPGTNLSLEGWPGHTAQHLLHSPGWEQAELVHGSTENGLCGWSMASKVKSNTDEVEEEWRGEGLYKRQGEKVERFSKLR